MNQKPPGAGRNSFALIETHRLFQEIRLTREKVFLDLGCGPGSYSMTAAQYLPEQGKVFAIDLWEEGLHRLKKALAIRGISNVFPVLTDIGQSIPLKQDKVDVCLMANVLHGLILSKKDKGALQEIARVLKPRGKLAVIEFKKVPGTPGPPMDIRIGASQLSDMIEPYGFRNAKVVEIGPYNYLALYRLEVNNAYSNH